MERVCCLLVPYLIWKGMEELQSRLRGRREGRQSRVRKKRMMPGSRRLLEKGFIGSIRLIRGGRVSLLTVSRLVCSLCLRGSSRLAFFVFDQVSRHSRLASRKTKLVLIVCEVMEEEEGVAEGSEVEEVAVVEEDQAGSGEDHLEEVHREAEASLEGEEEEVQHLQGEKVVRTNLTRRIMLRKNEHLSVLDDPRSSLEKNSARRDMVVIRDLVTTYSFI